MPPPRLACARRHPGSPSVLVGGPSPLCLPCAAAALRCSTTPALHLPAAAAASAAAPRFLAAAASANPAAARAALDMLDALCGSMRGAAEEGDAALRDAAAAAVAHVCLACDMGGRGLRFCGAVCEHAFALSLIHI